MTNQPSNESEDFNEPLDGLAGTLLGPRWTQPSEDVQRKSSKSLENIGQKANSRRVQYVEYQKGYGTNPNVVTPRPLTSRTLTLYQRHVIEEFANIILPATNEYPAPSEVGIADFFDEWVSAPYSRQVEDGEQVKEALLRIGELCHEMFKKDFLHLDAKQRTAVIDSLIEDNGSYELFYRLRYLVISGYFTTDIGMKALGYRGNTPLRQPEFVSKEALSAIEREMRKLGI